MSIIDYQNIKIPGTKAINSLKKSHTEQKVDLTIIPKKHGVYDNQGQQRNYFLNLQMTADFYMLLEPIIYVHRNEKNMTVVLPGFHHDYASKAVLKNTGKYSTGAILHDAWYKTESFTRVHNDIEFKNVMELLGTAKWRRNLYFLVVLTLGWISYKKHTKDSIQKNKNYVRIYDL